MMRLAGMIVIVACAIARADGSAEADRLFAVAQQLREQGKTAEACETFQRALALNANAIGTILNVARCAEDAGKVATAVRRFTEARDLAREQGLDPQREAAEDHLAKLAGRAPHLAIAFAVPPTPETKLVVANEIVDLAAAGDVVVDPGTVRIVVSAPGALPYTVEVGVAEHAHQAISIPRLVVPKPPETRRTVGKALTVIGAGTFAAAGVMALVAGSKWRSIVHTHCTETPPGSNHFTCSETYNEQAQTYETVGDAATGVAIAGLAVAGAGVLLWLVVPSHTEHAVAIVPDLSPHHGGLVASFRF